MINLISNVIAQVSTLLQKFQLKRFMTLALVGFLVLTVNVPQGSSNDNLGAKVQEKVQQNDADRPKTLGQWRQEAQEVKGNPGERLQRIGKESAEAIKEFGAGYGEGIQETTDQAQDAVKAVGKGVS